MTLTTLQQTLTRQLDLLPLDKLSTPITVIGAGAIGSWTTLALAKMGFFNITVWDFDTVSVENVNCQLYGIPHIDTPKVQALADIVNILSAVDIKPRPEYFKADLLQKGIVIMAVDSMKARAQIFNDLEVTQVTLIIDARMGAEKALLYSVPMAFKQAKQNYKATLYSDENAEQVPCTAKATSDCATVLSGLVAGQVKSYLTEGPLLKNMAFECLSGSAISFKH